MTANVRPWKPTYDVYPTRKGAEARCERVRKSGRLARIRIVGRRGAAGYTVEYKDRR